MEKKTIVYNFYGDPVLKKQLQLLNYIQKYKSKPTFLNRIGITKSVMVLEFADTLRSDKVLIDKAERSSNIKIIKNAQTLELIGEEKVTALVYKDRKYNENKKNEIDDKNRTNVKGIYVAGDFITIPYKQIVISVGEGAKAVLTVFGDLVFK